MPSTSNSIKLKEGVVPSIGMSAVDKVEPVTDVKFWVGLTKIQLQALQEGKEAEPPDGGRFGFRKDPCGALERATLFSFEEHPKDLVAVPVIFTAVGFTTMVLEGTLQDRGAGWFRWWATLKAEMPPFYVIDLDKAVAFM